MITFILIYLMLVACVSAPYVLKRKRRKFIKKPPVPMRNDLPSCFTIEWDMKTGESKITE